MLYTNKEQLPPSPPSLRDSLPHISYADRKHRQGGVPSSTSSKTPRSELANKVKRKICFALVNRNVYFAAAVDSFFHLHVRVEDKLCRFRKKALPLFAVCCQKKRERRLRFRR